MSRKIQYYYKKPPPAKTWERVREGAGVLMGRANYPSLGDISKYWVIVSWKGCGVKSGFSTR